MTFETYAENLANGSSKRATFILDGAGYIVMCGGESTDFLAAQDHFTRALRPDLRSVAREHIDKAADGMQASFVEPHWIVRTQPVYGREQQLYVLSIELVPNIDMLARAAQRFSLTRRELDVLTLMLDGFVAAEIAQALTIAPSTVQVYYKRLLSKTSARNRTAMVANVLAWHGGAHAADGGAREPCNSRAQA